MEEWLTWDNMNMTWDGMTMTWEKVFIEVEESIRKGGGYSQYFKDNPWSKLKTDIGEEKATKVIKLYCTYNDIEYSQERVIKNEIKIEASNFEKFVNDVIENKIQIKVSF